MHRWISVVVGAVMGTLVGQALAGGPHTSGEFFMPLFGDLRVDLDDARKDQRKGVVLIYEMEGCPFCERLKRTALRNDEVRRYYHSKFLVYRIDVKGALALTGWDGHERTESEFAAQQRVRATPTIVFYDLNGRELTRLVGPPLDATEFLLLGRYVADGRYASDSFDAYRSAQRKELR